MGSSSRDPSPPISGAKRVALPANVLSGFLDCLRAVGEYQDRNAEREQPLGHISLYRPAPWVPAHLSDLTLEELAEARTIARQQRYSMSEAADIVRRSRR